jgi:hypothetical protein
MKLYFTVNNDHLGEDLAKMLELKSAPAYGIIYSIDTNNPTNIAVSTPTKNENVMYIYGTNDLYKFVDVVQGKVLARFNDGKTKFSYIDFRPWIRAFDNAPFTFNKIEKYYERPEMLYEKMLGVASTLCFDELEKDKLIEKLDRLMVLAYKASLLQVGLNQEDIKPNLMLEAFVLMANVMEFGAKKYERNNWRKKPSHMCESIDSLMRHLKALLVGDTLDEDSGIHHLGHVMCNIMFIDYHFTIYYETADVPKASADTIPNN